MVIVSLQEWTVFHIQQWEIRQSDVQMMNIFSLLFSFVVTFLSSGAISASTFTNRK